MARAAEWLTAASDEMSRLVEDLQADVYRANGVRELLNLAFKVNSDAAVLSRRLSLGQDINSLRDSLRQLDQDWHTLEYRLGQTRNLSAATMSHLQRIQEYETKLTSLFELPTQVNLESVSTRAIQMSQSLRTLLQDIRLEVSDQTLADQLRIAGRDTYEQLQRFIRITRPSPGVAVQYNDLKREFLQLEQAWNAYQQRLRQSNNRYVQRQVQRMNDDMRTMHESLYISWGQINRDELKYSTSILRKDVDLLLRRINLKMLTGLPAANQRYIIEASSEFDVSCNDFNEILDDDIDNIRHLYFFLHDHWRKVDGALQGISTQTVRQAVRDVEQTLSDLQAMLGVRLELDRKSAAELTAQLAANARHMREDVRDFFSRPNRYPRDFQNRALNGAANFETAIGQVYDGLVHGESLDRLRQRTNAMVSSWESMRGQIPQFNSDEQSHLAKIQRAITPQLVQMQTLLAL